LGFFSSCWQGVFPACKHISAQYAQGFLGILPHYFFMFTADLWGRAGVYSDPRLPFWVFLTVGKASQGATLAGFLFA